jgi:predicted  nucleic acid-binding Zn-ribbon protein
MTESIFASFDVYLAAIDDYDRDFKAALADEKEAKDSTLNGEIAELNTSIVGIESDLKTLQASLDALQRQRDGKQAILVADAARFDSLSSSVGGTIASTKQNPRRQGEDFSQNLI